MAVAKNSFSGTLNTALSNAESHENHTFIGLTSETSSITKKVFLEASSIFLNTLYQTFIDAGYDDVIKDENEYSITVLGFKFFVFCSTSGSGNFCHPMVLTHGNSNPIALGTGSTYSICDYSSYINLNYTITIRGDKNHVSIYCSSYSSPTTEYCLFSIAKGKNITTESDIYLFGKGITSSQYLIRERTQLYTLLYNNTTNPLSSPLSSTGLNIVNDKFVCTPQLAYYNTCLIYSMIQGNTAIFTSGKYYKIGDDIYYDEGGYLYKVG